MKNRRIAFLLCAVLPVLFMIQSSAHSGGTDANGWHYERGEYHYHHGYPAHQHVDVECPYDFVVIAAKNSNGDIAPREAAQANVSGITDTEAFAYTVMGISISGAASAVFLIHSSFYLSLACADTCT